MTACCWSEGDDFQANRHGMRSNGRDHFALVVVLAVELVEVEKRRNQLGEGQRERLLAYRTEDVEGKQEKERGVEIEFLGGWELWVWRYSGGSRNREDRERKTKCDRGFQQVEVLRAGEKYGSRKNGEWKQRDGYLRENNIRERKQFVEREILKIFFNGIGCDLLFYHF